MQQLVTLLLLCVSVGNVFALRAYHTETVQVYPTNATEFGIHVDFNAHAISTDQNGYSLTNHWVNFIMPYRKGEFSFKRANLELTNGVQSFSVPVAVNHAEVTNRNNKTNDVLSLGFWMDKRTLGASSLRIEFWPSSPGPRVIMYILQFKDFLKPEETSTEQR